VPLLFAKVLGINSCNVSATVRSQRLNAATTSYGFAGLNSVTINGHSDTDSYNSGAGAYGSGNTLSNGDVASNGDIDISGHVTVSGDANPGANDTVSIGNHCSVSGSTSPLTSPLNYPSVDATPYASSNSNSNVPAQYINHGDSSSTRTRH